MGAALPVCPDAVPVFTASGRWVGEAASPDAISDLIDACPLFAWSN
ncbi:hypothetical protein AB0K74_16785 [Streptomyces sp. NPDC056159]